MPEGHRGLQPARRTAAIDPDATATDERFIADGRLDGSEDDDGFTDLRSVARYPESPLPGARWEPVVTNVGDSYRRVDDSMTFAREEYERGWLVVNSPSDLVHAYDMLINDIGHAATFAERVEPVDIHGATGWVVVDEGQDATSTVVTWSPETGRTISVRRNAPRDTVVDAARQLRPVTADEWTSSFPEAD